MIENIIIQTAINFTFGHLNWKNMNFQFSRKIRNLDETNVVYTVVLLKVRASDFEYKAFEDLNFEEMAKGTNNLTSIKGSILSEVLNEVRVFYVTGFFVWHNVMWQNLCPRGNFSAVFKGISQSWCNFTSAILLLESRTSSSFPCWTKNKIIKINQDKRDDHKIK